VQLTDADLSQVGSLPITVTNASEGNWTSNALNLTVAAGTPTLIGLSPTAAMAGSTPVTLTASGSSFMPNSSIQVNGATRSTTYISATQLSTTLTSADLAFAGTLSITVTTPNGGTSAALAFTVNNPVPSLAAMSPVSVTAGGPAFTLTVSGANFVPGSVVRIAGANRATTFVSSSQLSASIPASDIAVAGSLSVTVFNAAPAGGASSALALAVNNPVPSISTISPNPALALAGSFTLTVNGTGFVAGSVVRIDGAIQPTTFVDKTQLQARVNGGLLSVGVHSVTVFNPTPGGGSSNAVNLTIVSILGELFPGLEPGLALLTREPGTFVAVSA